MAKHKMSAKERLAINIAGKIKQEKNKKSKSYSLNFKKNFKRFFSKLTKFIENDIKKTIKNTKRANTILEYVEQANKKNKTQYRKKESSKRSKIEIIKI